MNPDLAPFVRGKRRMFCSHMANLSGRHVPNSLEAVADCVAAGAPRIEIDVRFIRGDAMLVIHDATLDAWTTGTGEVAALDRVSALQVRTRADERVRLAFFEEIVDLVRNTDTILQVDLKGLDPLGDSRAEILAKAMAPLGERALLGSQAFWNMRLFEDRGCRVALDPTLEWHVFPWRQPDDGKVPRHLNQFGIWDDSAIATIPSVTPKFYVEERIRDIRQLVRGVEWMVNIETIAALAELGIPLGIELAKHGIELAAWTMRDEGEAFCGPLLGRLFDCGVTTVITDHPMELAAYSSRLAASSPQQPH